MGIESLVSLNDLLGAQTANTAQNAISRMMASPVAASPLAPTAAVQPELSPTAKYIRDMQSLMQGGIGKLSTGEKLGAVGALLQAAGSRGKVNPADVIGKVREQQMQKLNAQYQLAQLTEKTQREQQQKAFIKQYASTLPSEKRGILENADTPEAFKIVQEEAFRPKQVFNRDRDPTTGNVRLTFSDGSSVVTDQKMPAKTREIDVGNAIELRNEDTNELVLSIPKQMSAYQAQSLNLQRARLARGGSGEGGGAVSYQFREDDQGNIVALNPKNPSAAPIKTGVKGKADPWASIFPPRTNAPIIRK